MEILLPFNFKRAQKFGSNLLFHSNLRDFLLLLIPLAFKEKTYLYYTFAKASKRSLPARLKRQQQRNEPCQDDQRPRDIDRNRGRDVREERNDWCDDTKNARRDRDEAIPGASILRGENLR